MSNEIVIHQDDIIKEGWLSKESLHLKNWKRRWVVLTPQYICSFKTEAERRNPTECIRVKDCSTVKSAPEDVGKENGFRVDTPDRTFLLVADNAQDRESWIGTIGKSMIRPTMMVEEYDYE
jgi:hypothetical protein